MDWKSNPWVGAGAAVLLVVGAAGLFYWSTGGGSGPSARTIMTFECDSTGEQFSITQGDLENIDKYKTYMDRQGLPTLCEICGREDAYQMYYCKECEKWYRHTERDRFNTSGIFVCPEGHTSEP